MCAADTADVRVGMRNVHLTPREHIKPEYGVDTRCEEGGPGSEHGRQMAMMDSSRSPGMMAEVFTPFKGLACTNSTLYMFI